MREYGLKGFSHTRVRYVRKHTKPINRMHYRVFVCVRLSLLCGSPSYRKMIENRRVLRYAFASKFLLSLF